MRAKRPTDVSKLKAECVDHVVTFETPFRAPEEDYPGIYSDPEILWNINKTDINNRKTKPEKVFGASSSKEAAPPVADGYEGTAGKHVTLAVGNNAPGELLDAYFVVEGKKMTGWTACFPSIRVASKSFKEAWTCSRFAERAGSPRMELSSQLRVASGNYGAAGIPPVSR